MSRLLLVSLLFGLSLATAESLVREIPSPAGPGSGQPYMTVSPDGRAYLSWIERLPERRFSLRYAVRERGGWTSPRVIAEGSDWFVNWADFPSMVALPDGLLAAHWLVKSGPETFDYNIHISRSFDGGQSWEKPLVPHRDGVRAEHGFVSLFSAPDGNLAAIWLDGREMKTGTGSEQSHGGGHGDMTLRYAKIRRDGTLSDEALLDRRVCECCQTAAALTSEGPIAVYRDRSTDQNEIRDISIVRLVESRWSAPQPVAADRWEISGCPVNGPAIAARDREVAVAWYTAAGNSPRVKLAFSRDAGRSFGQPLVIDDGEPIGRVDLLMSGDGSVLVSWLEKVAGGGVLRLRRVSRSGKAGIAVTIAPSGVARSNGFPQMILHQNSILFAWTAGRVLTAESTLPPQ